MIALTTDFGLSDSFVGAMKGVIYSLNPAASIVDVSHGVPPQDVVGGALVLEQCAPYFPDGTIHVGVVDPGVGTSRRAIALRTACATFIGPDNGLFDLATKTDPVLEAVALTRPEFWINSLPQYHARLGLSSTFHGRDIFAPAAAHLSLGVPLERLGERVAVDELQKLNVPEVVEQSEKLCVCVLSIDHFENLIMNLERSRLEAWNLENSALRFEFAKGGFNGLSGTFGDVPEGAPVAYVGSSNRLEIAVRNGSAALFFQVQRGSSLSVSKLRVSPASRRHV